MSEFKQIYKAADGYLINREGVVLNPSGRALKPFGNNQVKIKYLSGQSKTVSINVLVARNFKDEQSSIPPILEELTKDETLAIIKPLEQSCVIFQGEATTDDVAKSTPSQPITPENIEEVLEYNWIDKSRYDVGKFGIEVNVEYGELILSFKNESWLEHLQVEFGKLDPLPAFNFNQYLIDNGVDTAFSNLMRASRENIKRTKRNAELIVSINKLSAQLEY